MDLQAAGSEAGALQVIMGRKVDQEPTEKEHVWGAGQHQAAAALLVEVIDAEAEHLVLAFFVLALDVAGVMVGQLVQWAAGEAAVRRRLQALGMPQ